MQYKTEWVEFPDVEILCKRIGASPTEKKADGRDHYTLPVIYDPHTKTVISDSLAITKYLDTTYPDTPALLPEGTHAFQNITYQLMRLTVMLPIMKIIISRVPQLLDSPSQEYFRKTREAAFGRRLEDMSGEDHWVALENGLEKFKVCLEENEKGKNILLGDDRITYADVQLAAVFVWMRTVCGDDSEDWKRFSDLHGGKWAKFMEQFAEYEHVDN